MRKAIVEAGEILKDFTSGGWWIWTAICICGLLPGCGIIVAYPIVGLCYLLFSTLNAQQLVGMFCCYFQEKANSMYLSAEEMYVLLTQDLIRIWVSSSVLMVILAFALAIIGNAKDKEVVKE